MSDVSSATTLDSLVSQYRASISQPVTDLQNRQSDLNNRLSALGTLQTKLSTLSTDATNFGFSGTNSPFLKYAVQSSDPTIVTATATSLASAGSHTLKVSQLASNDALLSGRLSLAAVSGMTANTTFAFSVKVGSGQSRSVNVQLGAATTNGDVMNAIAAAVNNDSVLNPLVTASVVKVTETESRLVLTSKTSGASNAISAVGGDFSSLLGLAGVDFTQRTASTSTAAGFVKSGIAADSLNAKFTFDGIDISRESNAVNDVIPGVTLSLKAVQADSAAPISLQTAIDKDSVVKSIQGYITDYNSVISYVQSQTSIDATTKTRGVLAADSSTLSMRSSLRALTGGVVSGTQPGNPQCLADLGITINRDGTMVLGDTSTLEAAITSDIRKVSDLFTNSAGTGIANQMKTQLNALIGSGGSIASTTSGLRNQVSSITDRITKMNTQLDNKASAFRDQYAQVQVLMAQAQRTQQMVALFSSSGG
jgi:flagellar hook-associated protein 2